MARGWVRVVPGALALAVWAGTLSAGAAGEMVVTGTVRDVRGNPVAGAQVSRGPNATTTDALGEYALTEPIPGTYWLRVDKTGFEPALRQVSPVDAMAPVDFALEYRTRFADVTPRAAPGGADSARTVVLWAANPPGSCARIRDLDSGVEIALNPGTYLDQGTVAWTAPFTVPGSRADGAYQAEGALYDCATNQVLGPVRSRTYHVDSVAPVVSDLLPADGTTVNAPDVILSGHVSDQGAGLAQQPVSFWLEDVTAGSGFSYVWANGVDSSGRYYGERRPLIEGHTYAYQLKATDAAGNVTVAEASFLAGAPVAPPETVLTPPYLGGSVCGVIVCVPDPLAMAGRLDVFTVDRTGREWAMIERAANVTGPGLLTVWADIPEAAGTGATLCVMVGGSSPESGSGCRSVSPGLLGGVYKVPAGTTPVISVWLSRQATGEARAWAQVASIRYSWRP